MPTVHELDSKLDKHLLECMEGNKRLESEMSAMRRDHETARKENAELHKETMRRFDEQNRAAWKAVASVGLIVLGGVSSTIVGLILAAPHHP